jgi:sulfur relay (sulfurtransferase) complex TusBCD TusD component (DsrE family)
MRFTLLVTTPPESPVATKALDFARALVHQRHEIRRIFFFSSGVRNALTSSPLSAGWRTLMAQGVPVTVCSGSAARFDVDKESSAMPIAGMGDWLMATLDSDKLVTF